MYMDAIRVRVKGRVLSWRVFQDNFLLPFEFTFLGHWRILLSIGIVVSFGSCNQTPMFVLSISNCENRRIRVSRSEVLERLRCDTLSSLFSKIGGW